MGGVYVTYQSHSLLRLRRRPRVQELLRDQGSRVSGGQSINEIFSTFSY
jgi:hypothetical protein